MELLWEDPPLPTGPFFTRDAYDKYSLAPSVRELWAFLQRPAENAEQQQDCRVGGAKPASSPSAKARTNKDDSRNSEEEAGTHSHDSDDAGDCTDLKDSKVKHKKSKDTPDIPYPEPRVPFPCMSSLSVKDQKTYVGILMSKMSKNPTQHLMARVNSEVMQFMNYLQTVSNMCAEDYRFIPQAAVQYSEDYFRSCLECIRTLPQFYQVHEMTSLTGGTFDPGLTLTFEKQLLVMGNVDITDHKVLADAQLALDYHSVSSENPPAKKARDKHAVISGDVNAEKLCAHYEPHVCLTRDALVRLLDNHGPDFGDQWELPVWVKSNTGKGSSQGKTVFVDSPLLKTEVSVRERSHIFHEESLKLSITKTGRKHVFHLMTEVPAAELRLASESSQRNLVSFEDNALDFEVDLTDLETFGDSAPSKRPKIQRVQDSQENSRKVTTSPTLRKTGRTSECVDSSSESQQEIKTALTEMDDPAIEPEVSQSPAVTEQQTQDSDQTCEEETTFSGDSEDDRLVIDDLVPPAKKPVKQPETSPHPPDPLVSPAPDSVSVSSPSSTPQKSKGPRRKAKRPRESGDQLGEILRMQTAMLNPAKDASKHGAPQETASPQRTGPSLHSLVKPCVSSYLESTQRHSGENEAPLSSSTVKTPERKKILSQDLQGSAEDERDYDAPPEGNVLYKLYSLQDLLLVVRSSVPLTHTRRSDGNANKYVPVHVLPKLEYQLSYGVECLSSTEACQLWTETALHSSSVSYVAHINALTSNVALLRKLPEDWEHNVSCGFKSSKSLNILHHVLKKLTGLAEGSYLIGHKAGEPFVTIFRASQRKASEGSYDLQQVHCSAPPPPSGPTPWIPVDPSVVLPFHQKHGRVPCTFPPKPFIKVRRGGLGGTAVSKVNP
ncbi:little elongation complex subunit 2 isoform X2 [Genypterus blacodes]|uniref:little elongation complex subunit 2 isoform X2 n=1 Tax=Genypterus blacodes TaxID=154954 RepID=UPI003F7693D9